MPPGQPLTNSPGLLLLLLLLLLPGCQAARLLLLPPPLLGLVVRVLAAVGR